MLQSAKLSYSQGDMTSLRSDHFHRIFNNGTDPDVGWVCVVCVWFVCWWFVCWWFVCWYLVCALTQFIFDVGLLSVVSQMTGGMDGTALIVACVRSSGGVALSLACCFGCLHNLDNEDILQALKEWEEEMVTKMVARMNIERQEQQERQEHHHHHHQERQQQQQQEQQEPNNKKSRAHRIATYDTDTDFVDAAKDPRDLPRCRRQQWASIDHTSHSYVQRRWWVVGDQCEQQ